MEWILYIIYALIVIMLLVVLHEFGHFIVGYKSGIKINEFSVGFGPKIVSKVKNGIKYSLRSEDMFNFMGKMRRLKTIHWRLIMRLFGSAF